MAIKSSNPEFEAIANFLSGNPDFKTVSRLASGGPLIPEQSRLLSTGEGPNLRGLTGTPSGPSGGGGSIESRIMEALGVGRGGQTGGGSVVRSGPVTFSTFPMGEGQTGFKPLTITGGFAPGTMGFMLQEMMPKILASLTGAGGGPSRADLLDPRLADIDAQTQAATQAILNRFASLGRSAVGSTTQEALGDISGRGILERQRAMGDVDTLLANIATQRQGNLMQLIQFLMGQGMMGGQ